MRLTSMVFDVNTAERLEAASREARAVHRAVLTAFATTGRAPAAATFEPTVLGELHERDLVRLDASGAIAVAYPFSAVPTNHRVDIGGGPTVFSMCAIDALGVGAMIGRQTTVRSVDPHTRETVTVEITGGKPRWMPRSAVVFVGVIGTAEDCCQPTPSVDRCCGVLNFFADEDNAAAWHHDRPDVTGAVVDQARAYELGVAAFGSLLDAQPDAKAHRPAIDQAARLRPEGAQ
ncbi:MAG: alkylmercury lyase family protein [Jiangellaceae bacterium]